MDEAEFSVRGVWKPQCFEIIARSSIITTVGFFRVQNCQQGYHNKALQHRSSHGTAGKSAKSSPSSSASLLASLSECMNRCSQHYELQLGLQSSKRQRLDHGDCSSNKSSAWLCTHAGGIVVREGEHCKAESSTPGVNEVSMFQSRSRSTVQLMSNKRVLADATESSLPPSSFTHSSYNLTNINPIVAYSL